MEQERFDEFEKRMFNPPSDKSVKVWRYMDFTRFIALLNSGSLHLTRCDQFDDHFEGSVREREIKTQMEKYRHEFSGKAALTPDQLSALLGCLWKTYQRQYLFINCWHISNHESAALWNVYGKTQDTIAIQTTYARLRDALPPAYHIGEVKYLDHETYMQEEKEGFFNIMFKRKSFEHERELRVCYVDSYEFEQDVKDPKAFFLTTNTRLFETVPIDLTALIESVRVAPQTPDWLVKLVNDSLIRFGYNLPVSQSSFDEYPFW